MTQKLDFSLARWNDPKPGAHLPSNRTHPAGPQTPPVHSQGKALSQCQAEGHRGIREARQKENKTNFKDNKGNRNSYEF